MRVISFCCLLFLLSTGSLSSHASAASLTLLSEDAPPANFLKEGQPAGVGVELVQEMLARQQLATKIEFLPWARAYKMAQEQSNVGLFSCTRTAEREELFQWVGPLVRVKWALYGKRGATPTIRSLEDAKNYAIGAYLDDAREQFLKKEGFTKLDSLTTNSKNVEKLLRGRIDLWITTNLGMPSTVKEAGRAPEELEEAFVIKSADLYLAFSKNTEPAIVDGFRNALESMHADGTFAKIYNAWFPTETPPL